MTEVKKKHGKRKVAARGSISAQNPASTTSAADGRENGPIRRASISIFILFHLIAITCMAIPSNFLVVRDIRELVRPYMLWTGLFQSWDMFSPNPKSVNSYVKAVIITEDHHMHVWTFPRMEELSFAERYRTERYRKFAEVLPDQQNALLWPDVANHLARMFTSGTDAPDKVVLVQFQSDIKPGADESYEPVAKPNVFYDDYVQP